MLLMEVEVEEKRRRLMEKSQGAMFGCTPFGLRIKPLTFKLSTERAVDCLNDLLCCPCSQFLLTLTSPQASPQLIHHNQSGHK